MTDIEHAQLVDLFWKICDIACILQPELANNFDPKTCDTTDTNIKNVSDVVDMLRVTVKYTQFDLEACRRDISMLTRIIQSDGTTEQGDGEVGQGK